MIYDVQSTLYKSFLTSGGGAHANTARKDNRKAPGESKNANKPAFSE